MNAHHTVFVKNAGALKKFLRSLKLQPCPFCSTRESLNRHSLIEGYAPPSVSDTLMRGQRVFCCSRHRRGGCGRTFAVLFSWVLPRHTFSTTLLWNGLTGWRNGSSIKASWETSGSPLPLDSFYHLLQRLRLRLPDLRTTLCTCGAPPESSSTDPLRQTVEHLYRIFERYACPPDAFQLRLQHALMG